MTETKEILVGTRNPAKIDMIKNALLNFPQIKIISLNDIKEIDDSDLKEGQDFKENARIKSEYYFKKTGIPTISTDQIIWIEKWPEDGGFIVHIRELANPNSKRATDEEVGKWIENFVEEKGESTSTFHYGISYTDQNGTNDFVSIQRDYTLQKKCSPAAREGYVFDRYMINPKTREFRVEQPDSFAFENFDQLMSNTIAPLILKN